MYLLFIQWIRNIDILRYLDAEGTQARYICTYIDCGVCSTAGVVYIMGCNNEEPWKPALCEP